MSECDNCPGACCRYISVRIGVVTPDQARWARLHGVVIEGESWAIPAVCQHLTPAGRCGVYDARPQVCREFAAGGAVCKAAKERYETERTGHDRYND